MSLKPAVVIEIEDVVPLDHNGQELHVDDLCRMIPELVPGSDERGPCVIEEIDPDGQIWIRKLEPPNGPLGRLQAYKVRKILMAPAMRVHKSAWSVWPL